MAVSNYLGRGDLYPGLRNNNPGNLVDDGTSWQGQIGNDGKFIQFSDMSWGTRALATDLTNKIKKGLNTIRSIVTQYAPATDNNNVPAYIAAVSQDAGIGPDQPIPMDTGTLHNLMRAFISHENGDQGDLVSDEDIDTGISMMKNTLLTLFQSAIPAAEANPEISGVMIGAVIVALILWWYSE